MTMRAERVGDPSGRAACAERRTRSARQIVLAPRVELEALDNLVEDSTSAAPASSPRTARATAAAVS